MEGWGVTIPLFVKETNSGWSPDDVETTPVEKDILIANFTEIEYGFSPLKTCDENIKPSFSFVQTSAAVLGQAMEFITKLLVELRIADNWVQYIISAIAQLISVE